MQERDITEAEWIFDWICRYTYIIIFLNFRLCFSLKGISILKCRVGEHSPQPQFDTLQLCTAHWNAVPLRICV